VNLSEKALQSLTHVYSGPSSEKILVSSLISGTPNAHYHISSDPDAVMVCLKLYPTRGHCLGLVTPVLLQTPAGCGSDYVISLSDLIAECLTWKLSPDTQVFGGRPDDATSVDACKTACVAYPGCDGFDWTSDDPSGSQCWLSGPWISGINEGSAPGVTHYVFVDLCQRRSVNQKGKVHVNVMQFQVRMCAQTCFTDCTVAGRRCMQATAVH
jgi:hypothetical protein